MTLMADYQAQDLSAAIKHACTLGYNTASSIARIADEKQRETAACTWWWLYVLDGYRAVCHRTKPIM